MDFLSAGMKKKVAVVERWPLVEVWLCYFSFFKVWSVVFVSHMIAIFHESDMCWKRAILYLQLLIPL